MRTVLWLVFVVAACEPVPASSLAELEFPADFELDTRREVALRLDIPPGWDATGVGWNASGVFLSVRAPSGRPLFEGTAAYALEHHVRVVASPGVDRLEVETRTAGERSVQVVDIEDGVAAVKMGVAR